MKLGDWLIVTKLYNAQEAVFQRLFSDKNLTKSVNGVFDYVPDNTDFPYIVLGRIYSTPSNTKVSVGERVEVTLDIWSDYKGKKEAASIINQIEMLLEEEIEVVDADVIDQGVISREIIEETNDLYHGIVVYEILLDSEG